MPGRLHRSLHTVLLLAFAGIATACTDLSAVREWSSTSMQAAQFNGIVATYADTPMRLALYDADGAATYEEEAAVRAEQAKALEAQLALIADYMSALAALSADGATDYSKDVGALTKSLKDTGQVSSNTLGAVGKLATTLLNAATKVWQKNKVGELIEQANAPLQEILREELRLIVDQDFRRDLSRESLLLDTYFEPLLRFGGGSEPANAALQEWFLLRQSENARRVAALDSYLVVLDKIAEGHQKLFDERNKLDAVTLVKDLYKLAKEIRENIKTIVNA